MDSGVFLSIAIEIAVCDSIDTDKGSVFAFLRGLIRFVEATDAMHDMNSGLW